MRVHQAKEPNIYVYTPIYISIHIYIYIERERERDKSLSLSLSHSVYIPAWLETQAEFLCCNLKDNSFSSGSLQSLLLRLSTNWMRLTILWRIICFYSKSTDLNVNCNKNHLQSSS